MPLSLSNLASYALKSAFSHFSTREKRTMRILVPGASQEMMACHRLLTAESSGPSNRMALEVAFPRRTGRHQTCRFEHCMCCLLCKVTGKAGSTACEYASKWIHKCAIAIAIAIAYGL